MIKLGVTFLALSVTTVLAQNIQPFLMPPFTGEYRIANVFDHNYPFPFENTGGDQLTWWGDYIKMGYDGHAGYDWMMPEGTRLLAAAAGKVTFAGSSRSFCRHPELNRAIEGKSVLLRHDLGEAVFYTSYVHLSEIFVQEGDVVAANFTIGRSGNTGCSLGPHLHFSVKFENEHGSLIEVDPYGWQGSLPDPWANHEEGARSHNLWLEAPVIFRETILPEDFISTTPVWITRVRYMGVDDMANPNNEFIELKLNADEAPHGYYLGGHKLLNETGEIFRFPNDFYIYPKKTLHIYSGSGENTERRLYIGSDIALWDDEAGCVRLQKANGQNVFSYRYSQQSCD